MPRLSKKSKEDKYLNSALSRLNKQWATASYYRAHVNGLEAQVLLENGCRPHPTDDWGSAIRVYRQIISQIEEGNLKRTSYYLAVDPTSIVGIFLRVKEESQSKPE